MAPGDNLGAVSFYTRNSLARDHANLNRLHSPSYNEEMPTR
jgi:hypothetical protein